MKLKIPEKEIQSAILSYLSMRKIFAWKTGSGAFRVGDRFVRMGQVGVADIAGRLPKGRFLAIERKSKGKQPTNEQKLFLARISANGVLAFVAYDLDEVIKKIP